MQSLILNVAKFESFSALAHGLLCYVISGDFNENNGKRMTDLNDF